MDLELTDDECRQVLCALLERKSTLRNTLFQSTSVTTRSDMSTMIGAINSVERKIAEQRLKLRR